MVYVEFDQVGECLFLIYFVLYCGFAICYDSKSKDKYKKVQPLKIIYIDTWWGISKQKGVHSMSTTAFILDLNKEINKPHGHYML